MAEEGILEGQDSVFGDAFEDATNAPETTEKVEEPIEETQEAEEVKEPIEEVAEEPEVKEEDFKQKYKTLVGIHKHDKEEWEKEKARLLSEMEEKIKPEETKEKPEPLSYTDFLTDSQKEEIEEYEKDFAEVAKMEGLKRKTALDALRKEFQDKFDNILSQLTPATKLLNELDTDRKVRSEEEHFSAIEDAHAGYEKYVDDGTLLVWIESKPKYLQKGMKEIYEKGTAEEIIELLTDFKDENKITEAEITDPKLDEKRKALRSVPSRKTAVNLLKKHADDFDSAFEEASQKIS